MSKDKLVKGYYWVSHYNYIGRQILFYNGSAFESFKGDDIRHDEIENYELIKSV